MRTPKQSAEVIEKVCQEYHKRKKGLDEPNEKLELIIEICNKYQLNTNHATSVLNLNL